MLLLCGTATSFVLRPSMPRGHAMVVAAKGKKGKKGKKPKQQKKSGMDWARDFEVMPFDSSVLRPLADAAAGAFEARTGKPLDASLASGRSTELSKGITSKSRAQSMPDFFCCFGFLHFLPFLPFALMATAMRPVLQVPALRKPLAVCKSNRSANLYLWRCIMDQNS